MTVRWQNKYWYFFFPPLQRFGGWRRILLTRVAHLPSMGEGGSWFPDPASQNEEKANLVQRDISIVFVFQDFCSCKTCLPSGPHTFSSRGLPRWCPVTTRSGGGHRACAPSAGKAWGPRYLDWAPPEAVDGVGICSGFQELPHGLHLPPRRGGGQARVTAAAQHALVPGPWNKWSSAGREIATVWSLSGSCSLGTQQLR